MANSKFSYVRSYELDDHIPKGNWIVLTFNNISKFIPEYVLSSSSNRKNFYDLVKFSTSEVMTHFKDIGMGFCSFDNIHIVLNKDNNVYKRRCFKLCTYFVSCLTACFSAKWSLYFDEQRKSENMIFSGRVYQFPSDQLFRSYLTNSQMQHHRNNLLHTLFLAVSNEQNKCQKNTFEQFFLLNKDKGEKYFNESLFTNYGINYNNEGEEYKKGSILQKMNSDHTFDLKKDAFWDTFFGYDHKTSFNPKIKKFDNYEIKYHTVPDSWIVVRIDGKGFHKFSQDHHFYKPNDTRALNLMNSSAQAVMKFNPDITMAFGESDEYSFIIRPKMRFLEKHQMRLVTQIVSQFTAEYIQNWNSYIPLELKSSPLFDGRVVTYSQKTTIRDYLSWRQADCHINNMYNTVFWKLQENDNLSDKEARQATTKKLEGTYSIDKKRILSELGVTYDDEPPIHRKGSFLYRASSSEDAAKTLQPDGMIMTHEDIIEDSFWKRNSHLLDGKDSLLKNIPEQITMSSSNSKSALEFLKNMGKLKHLKRTGWVNNDIPDPETISGHMYRMAMAAMMFDETDAVDTNRVVRMCLVHDAAECIVGDITPYCGVSEEDKHTMETNAMKKLAALTPTSTNEQMVTLFQEYEEQITPESHVVKDLDKFDMILQAFEYEVATNKPGSLESFFKNTKDIFRSARVKLWVEELYCQRENFIKSSEKPS